MKSLLLIREYLPIGTKGILKRQDGSTLCEVLERPELNNQRDNPNTPANDSSCISEGIYLCKRYSGTRFKNTWILIGVKGRDAILIHAANTIEELLGCLAPCMRIISKDGKLFGESSQQAMGLLRREIGSEDFMLTITSTKTHCEVQQS